MKIGEKIKSLRIQNSLTQEELADRSELTKGFISQLERDLTSPSIATLVDILEGLGTNVKDFFSEKIEEKIVFSKEDAFETENDELKYVLRWIIPNAQKNVMEPILMEIEPEGRTKEDSPHEGEEFGYVINGSIYIHVGGKKHKVKKGESFYYKATSNHYISNEGKTKATVIWVSTPPSF
jgi:transcriptional regulator with XRE-family HTH domain